MPLGRKLFTKPTNGVANADRWDEDDQETSKEPGRGKLKERSTKVESHPPRASFEMPPIFDLGKENCDENMIDFDGHSGTSSKHNPTSNSTETSIHLSLGMHNTLQSKRNMTSDKPSEKRKKEVIRIRESLEGTFAIEEVDLTTVETRVSVARTECVKDVKTFRLSEISVVDLTTP